MKFKVKQKTSCSFNVLNEKSSVDHEDGSPPLDPSPPPPNTVLTGNFGDFRYRNKVPHILQFRTVVACLNNGFVRLLRHKLPTWSLLDRTKFRSFVLQRRESRKTERYTVYKARERKKIGCLMVGANVETHHQVGTLSQACVCMLLRCLLLYCILPYC